MHLLFTLCDAATVADGKLNLLGGGWALTGPGPFQSALGMIIELPDDYEGHVVQFRVALQDANGSPAVPRNIVQAGGFAWEGSIGFARHSKSLGEPLRVSVAIPLPPLDLPAGLYRWTASLNGEGRPEWGATFVVRTGDPLAESPSEVTGEPAGTSPDES